ncbi:TPA: cysteine hydrolase [Aeromonas hydrophila]|uniref:isochorismatase family cysteine hydrolase n=1 Tax=Aeromonas hydrophila TaxID=644 RepID=UPI000C3404D9|nr:isochorismatase family cysteine hydrolase [Aeromonas hydrophila]PKD22909.1 Isochorismatase [Aeromonas hydrophila]WRK92559.1 isochorismatase family cysteine hydrolase [Aeromonas hydrophila]HAT2714786.1 cysteine hydrolase [Aeromonas hydrophila]
MNKALLVIDFINDIAHPDGRIAASAAHVLEQDAIVHANQALAHARAYGWLVVLTKPRVSPFYGTALEPALRANHIDHLYLCGVSTSWAIQAAAREGHDRDYAITILEDACAAADANEHHASLRLLGRIAEICKVAQLA